MQKRTYNFDIDDIIPSNLSQEEAWLLLQSYKRQLEVQEQGNPIIFDMNNIELQSEIVEDESLEKGFPTKIDIVIAFNSPRPGMMTVNGTVMDSTWLEKLKNKSENFKNDLEAGTAEAIEIQKGLATILYLGIKPFVYERIKIDNDPLVKPAFDKLKGLFRSGNITDRVNANLILGLESGKLTLDFLRGYNEKARAEMIQELAKDSETLLSDKTQVAVIKPEKPKQNGRYRLTPDEIKRRQKIVKEANRIFKDANPKKTWKQIAYELEIPERTLRDWRHNPQY